VAVLAAVLAVTVVSILTEPGDPDRVIAAGAAPAPAPGPLDLARQVLHRQAAALARGDQAGWLAAVDPAIKGKYQSLYRTLRALHVTTVDYRVTGGRMPTVTVELRYCLSPGGCPAIAQSLTFKRAGDAYVIGSIAGPDRPTALQPTPWENGDLVFAQGKRVTVGAPRQLAGRLAEVVSVADRAAVVDDRYAAYVNNRQPRFRIFLATDKFWRTWYGGRTTDWAVGYMQPLAGGAADVVINPGRIHGRTALREVLQHEMGHVATIGGVRPATGDMWLVEGVAEYIAAQPRTAGSTYSRIAVRRPTSLVHRPLRDGAGRPEVSAFYALGHYAVECLATKFGEPRAMEFVRLRLRLGNSLDTAARSVFGTPFATVDRTCVDWIRQQTA
jgi:hypothetical protein